MRHAKLLGVGVASLTLVGFLLLNLRAQEKQPPAKPASSYSPVVMHETFEQTVERMEAQKARIEKRQAILLQDRYDLADRPAKEI